jgi:hypothetical protein
MDVWIIDLVVNDMRGISELEMIGNEVVMVYFKVFLAFTWMD